MNSALFTSLVQAEAEKLYLQNSTPEIFMSALQPLIQALVKENGSDILSENDLEKILDPPKTPENQDVSKKNSFFDIVDLCLYRAN